jgi:hypothetical protein
VRWLEREARPSVSVLSERVELSSGVSALSNGGSYSGVPSTSHLIPFRRAKSLTTSRTESCRWRMVLTENGREPHGGSTMT